MSEHEDRLDELYQRALELPPNDREAFIELECASDGALASALRDLLVHAPSTHDQFLGGSADTTMPMPGALPGPHPSYIGPYRVVREIGRGGMGVVYEAEQESPRRRVALKVVRTGVMSGALVSRFKREAQVLAQLQHRGIAHIYESGSALVGNDEVPYFAMEYIDGVPLDVHTGKNGLSQRQKLELAARVCDAVQHAHQKGIIHRDLKPGNVLVVEEATTTGDSATMIDAIGQPKILDFGIARFTDSDVNATVQTSTGQIVGTLAYMAPEQVAGRPDDLDTRCDVYALGVMLHTLLAGAPPHDLGGLPVAEAARIIREDDPTSLATIDASLRGDVTTIVRKAMDKDRERRYASAGLLADDIRRFLRDEPITARPASTFYQLRKFARRNRALVWGVAASFLLLALGVIGTGLGLASALRANEQLEQTNTDLEQVASFQAAQLSSVDVPAMGARMRDSLLDAAPEDVRGALEQNLAGVNFTNEALETIETDIFNPSLAAIEEQFAGQPLVRARLLNSAAVSMRELGLLDAATGPQSAALEIRRRVLGEDHRDTIESIVDTGLLLRLQRRFEEAEPYLREGLETARRVSPNDAEYLLQLAGNVGAVLHDMRRHADAEAYMAESLELSRHLHGDEHPHTLNAMNNMGANLRAQGKNEEAEPLYREALESRRRTLGEMHPSTLNSMNSMGVLLQTSGRIDEAKPFYLGCLAGRRSVLGDSHPHTLSSIYIMGYVHRELAEFTEAEPYYHEALSGYDAFLGPGHARTLRVRTDLAEVIEGQQEWKRAEALRRRNVEILREARPGLGLDGASALKSLGINLLAQSRHREAETALLEALELEHAELSPTHWACMNTQSLLGEAIAGDPDRYAEAEGLLLQAAREIAPPAQLDDAQAYIDRARGRVVDLYNAWHERDPKAGHDEKARLWSESTQPSGNGS